MPHRLLRFVFTLVAPIVLVGCSGASGKASVSGRVTHNGKPVANAHVSFAPQEAGVKPATGITDSNGRYVLGTTSPGDGAQAAKYQVSIIARGPDRPPKPGESVTGMPGEMMPGDPVIPTKYFAPDSSGLTFEVKRGSNPANFDLKD